MELTVGAHERAKKIHDDLDLENEGDAAGNLVFQSLAELEDGNADRAQVLATLAIVEELKWIRRGIHDGLYDLNHDLREVL